MIQSGSEYNIWNEGTVYPLGAYAPVQYTKK